MKKAQLVVSVEMNEDGAIKSSHRPLTPSDKKTFESWPSSGLAQMSHALFVEALRREAYTMMIAALSTGVHPHDLEADEVVAMVGEHVTRLLRDFTKSAVEEAFEVLHAQAEGKTPPAH